MTTTLDRARLEAAAVCLERGALALFPTETFFGLGCDARNARATGLVYQAKGRVATKPLPLVACSADMVARFCDLRGVPDALLALWPAPLTLVVPLLRPLAPPLADQNGCVAIRVSPHPVPAALSRLLGAPVTATSANRQGETPARHARDICPLLKTRAALVDLGPEPCGGLASTIVRPEPGRSMSVLRLGAFSLQDLERACPGIEIVAARQPQGRAAGKSPRE